jgi:hypothetical protein
MMIVVTVEHFSFVFVSGRGGAGGRRTALPRLLLLRLALFSSFDSRDCGAS